MSIDKSIVRIDERDTPRILEAHALLIECLGTKRVEDVDSFKATVSSFADQSVVPRLLCKVHNGRMLGAVLGVYLTSINIGMILYAGVRDAFRRLGIYSVLRTELIRLLNIEAAHERLGQGYMEYMVSELEPGSWLLEYYQRRWGAFVAPIDYFQPPTQGLAPRKLSLVFQPIARRTPPAGDDVTAIVREIRRKVYRLSDTAAMMGFHGLVGPCTR